MPNDAPIEALQKQLEAIAMLRELPTRTEAAEFVAWLYAARAAIVAAFGSQGTQMAAFDAIDYSLRVSYPETTDAEFQEAFRSGLDQAGALIGVFVAEKTAARGTQPTAEPVILADAMPVGPAAVKRKGLGAVLEWALSQDVVSRRDALIALASLLVAAFGWLTGSFAWIYRWAFRYPVELRQVAQWGSDRGYVVHVQARSTSGSSAYIPVESFAVTIVRVAKGREERHRMGGVAVFDKLVLLEAAVLGRTYANTPESVACVPEWGDVYLLLTDAGDAGSNPSMSFKSGRSYRSLSVGIRKSGLATEYLDVPIDHLPIISGDARTKILQK